MKRTAKSILEEINSLVPDRDKHSVIESRANHIISSAINLVNLIYETYGDDEAKDLERRLINSIKGQDANKFIRKIHQIRESKD